MVIIEEYSIIFLKFRHCQLESIDDALDHVTKNCYFGSADLKDVYCTIPINAFC